MIGAGRRKAEHPMALDESMGPAPGIGPAEAAILAEVWQRASEFFGHLPAPYAQIAHLQYQAGWSRADIACWLAGWRPVGEDGVRKLIRQTHEMLRSLGRGEELRDRWPGRFSRKNGWIGTPPPPFRVLKGRCHLSSSPALDGARVGGERLEL